ncbi:hypothetical protein GGI24_000528 [Coemansia furcata]|nr:hypothetical protein GGI24_000528 [Coemansia furcata]
MTDSLAGLPSRHIGMAHRRESSVSTNTSSCSSQTRVLPFATARAPQALGPSSRYAMARPRRVVTDNGKIHDPKRAAPPPRIAGRRHSAAIGTLLPVVGGSRTRAIIGLGLTLNPADAVVRLQPRNAATTRSQSIKQRQPAAAEPEIKAPEIKVAKVPVADLSPGLSLFASPRASLASSSSSPASLHSLRTGDPQPVTLPLGREAGQKEAVAAAEVASVEDLRSFVSCTSGVSPALPHVPQTPVTGAVRDITCVLCFERVMVTSGGRRGHAMRCPSCFGMLGR